MRVNYISSIGIWLRNKCLPFLAAFLSLCLLTACGSQYKNYDIVVEYQVPFAQSNPRWNDVELVEEDEHGRKIFSYKSVGAYTNVFHDYMKADYNNAPVLLYVIIQKTDRKFVYCYDDVCYAYVSSFENDNIDVIDNLKKVNDWGKVVNEQKLTALSIDNCRDIVMKYLVMSVEDNVVTSLEQTIGYEVEDYYLDAIFSQDSTPIFILREVTNREKHEFGKSFIFHIPDDDSKATYEELSNDIRNWNEEIHNFKASLR